MTSRRKHSNQWAGQPEGQARTVALNKRGKQGKPRKPAREKDQSLPAASKLMNCGPGDETAIYVAVRCCDRNERETVEDRAVTLQKMVSSFDRVFSSAADQRTVYEDTILPSVDEMLLGCNCSIFAYGQTGTGKTYTMSGEIVEESQARYLETASGSNQMY